MRRKLQGLLATILFLSCCGVEVSRAAESPASRDAGAAVRGLQAWLDGTRDLRGHFRQTLVSGALGSGLEESGRFWLVRPGKMRWDYTAPEKKVALLDGDRTLLWVAEDRQAWEGTLSESDSALMPLLASNLRLDETFRASLAPVGQDEGATFRLRLVPRSKSETFEDVTLELRAADHSIVGAEVVDGAGNRIRYELTRLERNGGIPPERFHFDIPPGTDVVRREDAGGG